MGEIGNISAAVTTWNPGNGRAQFFAFLDSSKISSLPSHF